MENESPLQLVDLPIPEPKHGEVLVKVYVCGVCHTELDEIEGRTPPSDFPRVLGHQVVGEVVKKGEGCDKTEKGQRVGVAWIFSACGKCKFCNEGRENLCDDFLATGRDVNGGYAEYMVVPESYVHNIPETFTAAEAAPLLCAGAVGYRSVWLAGLKNGEALGLTGFGASGHLVLKMVRFKYPDSNVYVFARSEREQKFAMDLGAVWAGYTTDTPPVKLNAIIDTTPVWKPVVEALLRLQKGGRLVVNAIRKEDIDKSYLQNISYHDHLWQEKEVVSVANVTSQDVRAFLELVVKANIKPDFKEYPLEDANKALLEMREGKIRGAKVLRVSSEN
ncbi:zinc-dependent alcohol dehydrogenase family protein [Mangrovimonas aestuarii]|uniref:zinc-dependent alcohol dehydrogenase family protein n=1 Tax=Mangrovimonas aestuarii TaxID=3018443 RepID=UPI002377EC34|nr:zinc-dependent alcohol dehydrogenase family protein [Mangrovimonas aestuarii]